MEDGHLDGVKPPGHTWAKKRRIVIIDVAGNQFYALQSFLLMLVKQRNIRNWLTNVKYIWRSISFSHILSLRILLTGFQQAILFNVSTSRGCYDVIISNSEPGRKSWNDWCFGNCFVCMQCSHFLYAMRSSHLSCKTKQVDVEPGCGSSKDRFFGRCFVCMQCYHLSIKHVKLKYLLCCNESCLVV